MLKKYKDWSPTSHDTSGLAAGDKGEWLVAPCLLKRDSDALERANYTAQAKTMQSVNVGAESDTEEIRFGHWACGWFEVTLVRPGSPAAIEAQALANRLEIYPVLDEDLWSV